MITDVERKVSVFVRTPYNYDADYASDVSGLKCEEGSSLTQQHMRDECDINVIVERFGITGQLPENPKMPSYGDFTGVSDFQTALHQVQQAEANFMELPASVRARFGNDPQKLLEFIEVDSNRAEAINLGLVKAPEPAPEPAK